MSRLLLVRHGQARYFGEQADQLTELGQEQSRLLGQLWARQGLTPDRVLVGPCRRHAQTLEQVRQGGASLPEAEPEQGLDEYPAVELFRRAVAERGGGDPAAFESLAEEVMQRYVDGRLVYDDLESFVEFRARVERAVRRATEASGRGSTVVAFTSGGPVAATLGLVLGLDNDKVLELSWTVRNGAVAEIIFGRGRLSLGAYNAHPHLEDRRLITVR